MKNVISCWGEKTIVKFLANLSVSVTTAIISPIQSAQK